MTIIDYSYYFTVCIGKFHNFTMKMLHVSVYEYEECKYAHAYMRMRLHFLFPYIQLNCTQYRICVTWLIDLFACCKFKDRNLVQMTILMVTEKLYERQADISGLEFTTFRNIQKVRSQSAKNNTCKK